MSSEPKNIMTMAELLRAAKLKREREEQEEKEATLPPSTIVPDTIPNPTIPNPTILNTSIPENTIPRSAIPNPTIPRPTIVRNTRVKSTGERSTREPDTAHGVRIDSSKGYFQYLNDLSDRVIPEIELKPFEQVVLNRLYRLSRGWKSEECAVGLGALSKQCVMSRTSVQKSIGILIEKGLIEDLGEDKKGGKEGKRYRVLPGLTIPPRTILKDTIVNDERTIPPDTTEVRGTIPPDTTIKDNNKDLKDTHTNSKESVGGSKFTYEECQKYAAHLHATGQGITNPGGYATTIHRTGEVDPLIEKFLNPPATSPTVDASKCPDCEGTNYWYPKGVDNGVARCKHTKLC